MAVTSIQKHTYNNQHADKITFYSVSLMMPLKTMVWSKYREYLQTTTTFSTQCGDCEDCGEVPAHSCVPGSKCQLATVLSRWGIFSVRRISLTILCQLLSQAWNHHKTVLRLASLENGIGNLTEKVLSLEWHVVGCCSWSISSWHFIWALCLFAQNDQFHNKVFELSTAQREAEQRRSTDSASTQESLLAVSAK